MRITALAILLCIGVMSTTYTQQETSATVVQAQGWFPSDRQDRPLTQKEKVLLSVELVARGRETGLILSCPRPGSTEVDDLAYTCHAETCRVRTCAPNAAGTTIQRIGFFGAVRDVWAALWEREPLPTPTAAARAGGNPSDAVVLFDARGAHWGPALARVLEGESCFQLHSLPATPSSRSLNFAFDWDRSVDPEGLARVPNLAPALYTLEKGHPGADGSCQFDPDNVPAWVLVVADVDFRRLDGEWKRQLAFINELEQSGTALSTISTLRHAALAHLAASPQTR